MLDWTEVDPANPPTGEVALFFPAKPERHLVAMIRVARIDDYPNRRPTHWAPVNAPEGHVFPTPVVPYDRGGFRRA